MKPIQLRILGDSTILLGDVEVTPSASHVFALLLVLALALSEGVPRRELLELLFEDADSDRASHRLRQLFYRLRQSGVVLRSGATGALQIANPIGEPIFYSDRGDEVERLSALPHYRPRLPATFLAWLDRARDRIEEQARSQLLRAFREAHRRQDWVAASSMAGTLLLADPSNEEVAVAAAESRAMLGQQDEALEILDRFVREMDVDGPSAAAIRKLRARIARAGLARREGTLRGREECLELLAKQWEQAAEGGGRLCVVLGPAGMGKTRVAETFAAKVRLGGGRVVTYRCDRQASQHPLALFSAVLPELQAMPGSLGVSPANRVTLERLGPSMTVPPAEVPGLVEAEARRAELQRALADLLEAVSAERPLLLVVDDAHLLDEASSDVLRTLSDSNNAAAVLIVGFSRPRTDSGARLMIGRRATSYVLPPLTDTQAGDLLLELRAGRPLSPEQSHWTLAQASGNPFYIHALSSETTEHGSLPAHVRSLAACAYFSLTPNARTVLEACLVLGTLATLRRVRLVSSLGDSAMASALRELEDTDLVKLDGKTLRGPHSILNEPLQELIPSAVAALVHLRIAETLSEECTTEEHTLSLAWAAVQSWLSAGYPLAAITLASRCAQDSAQLGEPQAGAELLSRIPHTSLPVERQRQLWDDLYALAEAGNCETLLAEALRERRELAVRLQEGPQALATIRLNELRNDRRNGGDQHSPIQELKSIFGDSRLTIETRLSAGQQLLALADVQFDSTLGRDAYAGIRELVSDQRDPSYVSASIIYHVAFGEVVKATELISLALALSEARPQPSMMLAKNASLALLRIGNFAEARDLARSLYERFNQLGMYGAAEFTLSIAIEADICLGDVEDADGELARFEALTLKSRSYGTRRDKGYLSAKLLLLLQKARYPEIVGMLDDYLGLGYLSYPRHRAISLSHIVLLKLRSGYATLLDTEVEEIKRLYECGCCQGGLDICVEALWCAYVSQGRIEAASTLLREYLFVHRRELGGPEWSLRRNTADDPSWFDFGRRLKVVGSKFM